MKSCLYECHVMHARFQPRRHRFAYRIFLFALDLDELDRLSRRLPLFSVNRPNLYAFFEKDYLPTEEALHNAGGAAVSHRAPHPAAAAPASAATLKQRVIGYLSERGVDLIGGRVMLVTLPRVAGFGFNPVSFYFCFDASGAPVGALAEVTNTFREMKPYWLGPETRAGEPGAGATDAGGGESSAGGGPNAGTPRTAFRLRTPKHFYVSPYSDVDVAFDFVLRPPDASLAIQIDDYAGAERTLTSSLRGRRRELTGARLAWFAVKYPLLTLRIISLIHAHAFLLWLKRVPWFAKGARAGDQRALYRPHKSLPRSAPAK